MVRMGWRPSLADGEPTREDLDVVSVPGWKPKGLQHARKSSRMTQADLAARLSVPRELVGRWEADGAPRADRVAQLMEVLNVELSALVDSDNPFTARRLQAGLSQQRLAELAGVPRSTVQALEAAAGTPSPASTSPASTSPAALAIESAIVGAQAATTRPPSPEAEQPTEPARRRRGPAPPQSSTGAEVRWRPGALRQARKAAGLTQAELAAAVGVTREAVGRWEAGTAPRLERVREVASALGLDDVTELVERPVAEWASLAALRVHAGLSQRRLAEMSGLPRSSIQAVERGAFRPSDAMVRAYAEVCGVSVSTVESVVAKKV